MKKQPNNKFMAEAIRLSLKMTRRNKGGPFGAIVIRSGKIIARGSNKVISSNDPTAHAEIIAIRDACKKLKSYDLSECELYTSCEPCPMCLGAIYWARLDKIYYANDRHDASKIGFDDDFIYREFKKPLDKRKLKIKQLMRNEALRVFKEWRKKEDKILY